VPFTGTFIKAKRSGVCFLMPKAAVPMPEDIRPKRPMELDGGWVQGTEWLYAGASPIIAGGCSCQTMRHHTDWYKRSFVPEAYRHSVAVLDTAGNLVMHIGRYGNFDDAGRMKPGTPDIPMTAVRFVSATDNYLAFADYGERRVILRLEYHAEETVGIAEE
jgi:hypothetical protein